MALEGSSMENSGRKTGTAPKQTLRAYIPVYRQGAEREHPPLRDTPLPAGPHLLILPW